MKSTVPYNFGGLSPEYSDYSSSKAAVLPVPFDKTSSWMKGSDKGPRAIINASRNMELYDIETDSEVYRNGIFTARPVTAPNSRSMIRSVHRKVTELLQDKKFVVLLGGEHMVSLGSIHAHAELFSNISILHLDAHSDMRDSYEGDIYSHACIMARAREVTDRIVAVGIRSTDSSELKNINRKDTFTASAIHHTKNWMQQVAGRLTRNVYISIDLDVFDSSIMPSTGTPEPGGLGWYDVVDLLQLVMERKNVIGLDVVELCPSKQNPAPDFLAAKLIYKLLSMKFKDL